MMFANIIHFNVLHWEYHGSVAYKSLNSSSRKLSSSNATQLLTSLFFLNNFEKNLNFFVTLDNVLLSNFSLLVLIYWDSGIRSKTVFRSLARKNVFTTSISIEFHLAIQTPKQFVKLFHSEHFRLLNADWIKMTKRLYVLNTQIVTRRI